MGTGGDRTRPGLGSFTETPAFVAGEMVGYFTYPFPVAATGGGKGGGGMAAASDPLRLREGDKPTAAFPAPTAYVFDPTDAEPIPDHYACVPPPDYQYDRIRDEYRKDEQGNVFTALPKVTFSPGVEAAPSVAPVMSETKVSSSGIECQSVKSSKTLLSTLGEGEKTGRYLAWVLIEPGAAVYRLGESAKAKSPGVGTQRWGWFDRYLVAYLDGGYIPTAEATVTEAMVDKTVVRMVPQKLYYPRSMIVTVAKDGTMTMAAGKLGAGYDVMQFKRGDQGYSPVCDVTTYDPGMALTVDALPKDAAAIEEMAAAAMTMLTPANPRYVYCLQVK